MSGLIQRLLDRGSPALSSAPAGVSKAASATRSRSPMAEHDQRLQDPGFRGLMGLTPVLPSEPVSDSLLPDVGMPAPDVQRRAPEPTVRRRLGKTPAVAPPIPPATESGTRSAATPPPVFDPIAALRRSETPQTHTVDREQPTVRPQEPVAPPSLSPTHTEVVGERELPTAGPRFEESRGLEVQAPQPTIVDRLPTDPPSIEALPPSLPMPEPLPPIARPTEASPPVPDVSPAPPSPSPEAPMPDIQTVRPSVPRPAVEQVAAPEVTPAPAQNSRERIIERVIREVHAEPAAAPQQPRPRVSANSVSKIGALPERRRAFTLFGLRRG